MALRATKRPHAPGQGNVAAPRPVLPGSHFACGHSKLVVGRWEADAWMPANAEAVHRRVQFHLSHASVAGRASREWWRLELALLFELPPHAGELTHALSRLAATRFTRLLVGSTSTRLASEPLALTRLLEAFQRAIDRFVVVHVYSRHRLPPPKYGRSAHLTAKVFAGAPRVVTDGLDDGRARGESAGLNLGERIMLRLAPGGARWPPTASDLPFASVRRTNRHRSNDDMRAPGCPPQPAAARGLRGYQQERVAARSRPGA
jgi:hypothetical protein